MIQKIRENTLKEDIIQMHYYEGTTLTKSQSHSSLNIDQAALIDIDGQ